MSWNIREHLSKAATHRCSQPWVLRIFCTLSFRLHLKKIKIVSSPGIASMRIDKMYLIVSF